MSAVFDQDRIVSWTFERVGRQGVVVAPETGTRARGYCILGNMWPRLCGPLSIDLPKAILWCDGLWFAAADSTG